MRENIQLAFEGIWSHKLRSILTMLGIIIGIAAIITIVSTIKGTNEQIKENLIGAGIYLEKPFLRTENGETFAYVLGENDRLEKRVVKTGKTVWGSYMEILSGLSPEDLIAFPYGKNVKPGVKAELGDISQLYG